MGTFFIYSHWLNSMGSTGVHNLPTDIEDALIYAMCDKKLEEEDIPHLEDTHALNPTTSSLKTLAKAVKEAGIHVGMDRKFWRALNDRRHHASERPLEHAQWNSVSNSRLRVWLDSLTDAQREVVAIFLPPTLAACANGQYHNAADILQAQQHVSSPRFYSKEHKNSNKGVRVKGRSARGSNVASGTSSKSERPKRVKRVNNKSVIS